MAKPASSSFIPRYFHRNSLRPSTSHATGSGISHFITSDLKIVRNPIISYWLATTSRVSHFPSPTYSLGLFPKLVPRNKFLPGRNRLSVRYYSSQNFVTNAKIFAKNLVQNPDSVVKSAVGRYGEVVRLQVEAFWKRNYLVVLGACGIVVCILLWRVLLGITNAFVGFSEGMAKYGFLALSSAIVAFTGLYFRSKYTISRDKVYRMAMRRLYDSPGVLEVMGAPLAGTDLRAYVMSGGGITLKNLRPRLRSKRCFLIFPLRGTERKGLVSVEVKKTKGQYNMRLLAVDIPIANGPDHRLFLIGNEEEYRIGDGLISELRDPVVKALEAAKEFEVRDEKEEKEDASRELEEAERRHQEELEKLEKASSQ